MIKGIALAKKKIGMPNDEFHRYWRQTHAPLALKISGMRRYVQAHRSEDVFPGFESCIYDGIAEIWFDDLEALINLPNDQNYIDGAQADEPNFIDMDAIKFIATTEKVFIEGPKISKDTQCTKAVFLLTRKAGMSVSEFQDYWVNGHAPQIPTDAGIVRYAQNHTVASTYDNDTPAYDGVAELWFENYDAFTEYWTSDRIQAIFAADAPKFLDAENCTAFIAEDNRVLWPD